MEYGKNQLQYTNYRLEKLLKCGSPILVVKAVILPNLVYDKMRLLYNITKSGSIDLPQKRGGRDQLWAFKIFY